MVVGRGHDSIAGEASLEAQVPTVEVFAEPVEVPEVPVVTDGVVGVDVIVSSGGVGVDVVGSGGGVTVDVVVGVEGKAGGVKLESELEFELVFAESWRL